MPTKALRTYMDAQGVRYNTLKYSTACTAQEVAANVHISGHNLARTVIVSIENRLAMVVLLASRSCEIIRMVWSDDERRVEPDVVSLACG